MKQMKAGIVSVRSYSVGNFLTIVVSMIPQLEYNFSRIFVWTGARWFCNEILSLCRRNWNGGGEKRNERISIVFSCLYTRLGKTGAPRT